MNGATATPPSTSVALTREPSHWVGRFVAMASPCEVLLDTTSEPLARQIVEAAASCAWRIERKYSRYRSDNIVHEINSGAGRAIVVDDETASLLDFAAMLTRISDGAFDITSGVLRKIWIFDGGTSVPTQAQIDALLSFIGWHHVRWRRPMLQLQPGMQVDFGGIGKEYAVDLAAADAAEIAPGLSCLINFGGDIAVRNPRHDGQPWRVGIEASEHAGTAARLVNLYRGGLATSGDSRRYVARGGRRYSHIIDARTGWPLPDAPRSVTVAADSCTQAGTLATLAMLQGSRAERFLRATGTRYWIQRAQEEPASD